MNKYVIINEEDGMMLASIRIESSQFAYMVQEKTWTRIIDEALKFEVAEEAEAVITFISDVMDWELAQQLYCKYLKI